MSRERPRGADMVEWVRTLEPLAEFGPAADETSIASVELRLGARLPNELRAFLLASDGATTGVDVGAGQIMRRANPLVWSIAEIGANVEADPILRRPRHVLFFANAGVDGILFGHPIHSPRQVGPEVVWWNPVENELTRAAPSFRSWLESWLTGDLTV